MRERVPGTHPPEVHLPCVPGARSREARCLVLNNLSELCPGEQGLLKSMTSQGHLAHLDQCAYGAVLPDDQGIMTPIRKPTSLCLTSSSLADELSWKCPGGHRHLPIEGSSPGIGNRAKASATYQPKMCKYLATSIDNYLNNKHIETVHAATDEPSFVQHPPFVPHQFPDSAFQQPQTCRLTIRATYSTWNSSSPFTYHQLGGTEKPSRDFTGIWAIPHRLNSTSSWWREKRMNAYWRPTELSSVSIAVRKHLPTQVPKSSIYKGTFFNDRVQADTMWLKVRPSGDGSNRVRAYPILVISDATTRLCAARLLHDETPDSFPEGVGTGLDSLVWNHASTSGR